VTFLIPALASARAPGPGTVTVSVAVPFFVFSFLAILKALLGFTGDGAGGPVVPDPEPEEEPPPAGGVTGGTIGGAGGSSASTASPIGSPGPATKVRSMRVPSRFERLIPPVCSSVQ